MYKHKLQPAGEEFLSSASSKLEFALEVPVPAAKLWETIMDQSNWTKAFSGLKKCEVVAPGLVELHAKRVIHLGPAKWFEEITIFRPEEAFGFTILEGSIGMYERAVEAIFLERIDANSTRLMYRSGVEFKGFYKFLRPISEKFVMHVWSKGMKGFAEIATQ